MSKLCFSLTPLARSKMFFPDFLLWGGEGWFLFPSTPTSTFPSMITVIQSSAVHSVFKRKEHIGSNVWPRISVLVTVAVATRLHSHVVCVKTSTMSTVRSRNLSSGTSNDCLHLSQTVHWCFNFVDLHKCSPDHLAKQSGGQTPRSLGTSVHLAIDTTLSTDVRCQFL